MRPDEMTIEELEEEIGRAREFAKARFNSYRDEETTPSGLFDPITCQVTFPEPDRMCVCKVLFGKPSIAMGAEYRLSWNKEGKMVWMGHFLLRPDIKFDVEVKG